MLKIEVGSICTAGRKLRHYARHHCLINAEPVHERVIGRCVANGGRLLNTAAGQETRHGQNCATRGHTAEEISAFDSHDIPYINFDLLLDAQCNDNVAFIIHCAATKPAQRRLRQEIRL